jgi:pyruvate formate lyase activating enzyme
MGVRGTIHSYETCGAVDGPGIRFVVFVQGCPLRCGYCQNPDTWKMSGGVEIDSADLVAEIEKYRSYMRFSGGGVTLTGGEPLMQPDFSADILRRCGKRGMHTALDTSGFAEWGRAEQAVRYADLVLLDLKCIDPVAHRSLTGADVEPVLDFARHLSAIAKPAWIRHVLVPGITDREEFLDGLGRFIAGLKNIELVELLPLHHLGAYKWNELGYGYRLRDVATPDAAAVAKAVSILKRYVPNVR